MSKRSRESYEAISVAPFSTALISVSQRTCVYPLTKDAGTTHSRDNDRRNGVTDLVTYEDRDNGAATASTLTMTGPASRHDLTSGNVKSWDNTVHNIPGDAGNVAAVYDDTISSDSKRSNNGSNATSSLSIGSLSFSTINYNVNGKVAGLSIKIPSGPRQLHTTINGESKQYIDHNHYTANISNNHQQHSLHDDSNDIDIADSRTNPTTIKRARTTTAVVLSTAVVNQLLSIQSSMPSICALSPSASPLPYLPTHGSVTDLDDINHNAHKQVLEAVVPSQRTMSSLAPITIISTPSPFTHHPVSSPSSYSVSSSPDRGDDEIDIPVNGAALSLDQADWTSTQRQHVDRERAHRADLLVHLSSLPAAQSTPAAAATPAYSSPAHSEAASISSSPSHSVIDITGDNNDDEEAWSTSLLSGSPLLPDLSRASSNDDHARIIDYNQYQSHSTSIYSLPSHMNAMNGSPSLISATINSTPHHNHNNSNENITTLPAPLALIHSISNNTINHIHSSLPSLSFSSSISPTSSSSSPSTSTSPIASTLSDVAPSSLSCHRIDWSTARARLPITWHNGVCQASTKHRDILNYLQRLVEFVNTTPLPEVPIIACYFPIIPIHFILLYLPHNCSE
jgi:hypothetical protein